MEDSKSHEKSISILEFDGAEATTDLVFYIIYRYFSNSDLLSSLQCISINSCRYVTDFGLELLALAVNKPIEACSAIGCNKLIKYKHQQIMLDPLNKDLFSMPSFNKLYEKSLTDDENHLNTCKILILNNGNINLTKFIQKKEIIYEKPIVNYAQVKLKNGNVQFETEYTLNVFEIDMVFKIYINFEICFLNF